MSNEPIDTVVVDSDTDDLDTFSDLFMGKTESQETNDKKVEIDEVKTVEEDDAVDEDEDNSDDAPDGDDDSDEDPQPKSKKVNRYQERINELTAKARGAERALEALKTAQEQQKESAKVTPPVVQDDVLDPDAKNPDGSEKYPLGDFDPQYIRDMARQSISREWEARKEQEAQEQSARLEQEALNVLQEQWAERLTPATEKYEDFLDKTMQLEGAFDGLDAQYSDFLVNTIKSLDHGPDVLYYFANNLDEAKQFVKLGPLQAALALGEVNAMFKGQTRQADPKVSKAPPPPQVNKGSKTRMAVNPDTDDLDDFERLFLSKKK